MERQWCWLIKLVYKVNPSLTQHTVLQSSVRIWQSSAKIIRTHCKSNMQINNFPSTESMKLPSGAASVDPKTHSIPDSLEYLVWQVAKESSWHPGLLAMCSRHLRLCPSPLWQRSSPLRPEGEEGVAPLRPDWTVGWRRLHSVPICQWTDPRAARAHPGIDTYGGLTFHCQ